MSSPFAAFVIQSPVGQESTALVTLAGAVPADMLGLPGELDTTGSSADDAVEYAQLSIKRWKYYTQQGFSAPDLPTAKSRILADPEVELGFLLIARHAEAPSATLGFAFARRVLSGRFVVDFLSVHPKILTAAGPLPAWLGLGSGLLASVARLTLALGGRGMWGEATRNSHGFYRRMFAKVCTPGAHVEITDFFRFEGAQLSRLAGLVLLGEPS